MNAYHVLPHSETVRFLLIDKHVCRIFSKLGVHISWSPGRKCLHVSNIVHSTNQLHSSQLLNFFLLKIKNKFNFVETIYIFVSVYTLKKYDLFISINFIPNSFRIRNYNFGNSTYYHFCFPLFSLGTLIIVIIR